MCPIHAVLLEDSNALWRNPRNPSKFISASKALLTIEPRAFDASNFSHNLLLKLAQHAAWLLNWHDHDSDIGFLRKRYYNLLLERGLAFYNGRIRTAELSKQLMEFYSTEFLNSLQCNIERHDRGWVYSLVHTNTEQRVQHPLRHLLLMTFLGCTAQEFFTSFEEYNPFGKGPWPCFNKASNHSLESLWALSVVNADSSTQGWGLIPRMVTGFVLIAFRTMVWSGRRDCAISGLIPR
jgi:hypothetical protein